MKKIIYFIGIICLSIVLIINILFTTFMERSEHLVISWNSFIYILGIILTSALIFFATRKLNNYLYKEETEKLKGTRRTLLIAALVVYIVFNILWLISVFPPINADQIHTVNFAQDMLKGTENYLYGNTYAGIPLKQYMQGYTQQITLAFVYSILFKLMIFDIPVLLRFWNLVSNILIVFALYKITKQLDKKHKTNKVLLFTLTLTFVSLPMLTTFVYGDIPGLAMCLFSIYFMMKYEDTQKWYFCIIASVFTMLGYMMRMNSLIFIIATVMYLLFNLFKGITKRNWKDNLLKSLLIIVYIAIAILPATAVKNYYMTKYNMDKSKAYPSYGHLLMAMEEGPRQNGWYNGKIGEYALKNPEKAREEYPEKIKERLTYFSQNLGYAFDFYSTKIASMWAENTYGAVWYNIDRANVKTLEKTIEPITFYQKALLILSCVCSIIILIQNRKNLSLELIFLVTIFIGGFAFHILWEAKSRYIIPYVVILIPLASVEISKINIRKNSN